MTLQFKNVYVIRKEMARNSLSDFYWPENHFNEKVQERIQNGQEYEFWFCEFLDHGLKMKILVVLNDSQRELQKQYNKFSQQPNLKKHQVTYESEFQIELPPAELTFQCPISNSEQARKTIYIASRFAETADSMWAAQSFPTPTEVQFRIGFYRPKTERDEKIIQDINRDLETLSTSFKK